MSFDLSGYVDVAERIRIFKEKYPNGSLQPANLEKPYDVMAVGERLFVVYVAAAYRQPDDQRPGIGVAWECFPGRTTFTKDSELMNAETSAWGRAIIAALAADTQKIASADEVRNRQDAPTEAKVVPIAKPFAPAQRSREQMIADADQKGQAIREKATATSVNISEAQVKLLSKLGRERGVNLVEFVSEKAGRTVGAVTELTKKEASGIISALMNGEA
jgi:hypothetical protein